MRPSEQLIDTTASAGSSQGYSIPVPSSQKPIDMASLGVDSADMPHIKPEDVTHFGLLMESEENMTPEEIRDRKIMMLLLKIKNGTPPMRK
jgi:hypothetical protein